MPLETRPLEEASLARSSGCVFGSLETIDPSARRLMTQTTMFLARDRHVIPEGCLAA